uniref:Uncharacterized protein n=1 Tax=Cucumis melo TaxID=3656 RepID=A0A9I9EAV7_CUCME
MTHAATTHSALTHAVTYSATTHADDDPRSRLLPTMISTQIWFHPNVVVVQQSKDQPPFDFADSNVDFTIKNIYSTFRCQTLTPLKFGQVEFDFRITMLVLKANAIFSSAIHLLSASSSDFIQNYYVYPLWFWQQLVHPKPPARRPLSISQPTRSRTPTARTRAKLPPSKTTKAEPAARTPAARNVSARFHPRQRPAKTRADVSFSPSLSCSNFSVTNQQGFESFRIIKLSLPSNKVVNIEFSQASHYFKLGILADVVPFHLHIKTIKDLKSFKNLNCQMLTVSVSSAIVHANLLMGCFSYKGLL